MYKRVSLAAVVAALLAVPALASSSYDKPGFVTKVEDGRLWVFKEGSKELEQFQQYGEPTVNVSRIGEGPEGMTLKAPSQEVLDAYNNAK
jgi:hypothetical protein